MGDIVFTQAKDHKRDIHVDRSDARKENCLQAVVSYLQKEDLTKGTSGDGRDFALIPDWCRKGKAIIADREDGFLLHPSLERRSG